MLRHQKLIHFRLYFGFFAWGELRTQFKMCFRHAGASLGRCLMVLDIDQLQPPRKYFRNPSCQSADWNIGHLKCLEFRNRSQWTALGERCFAGSSWSYSGCGAMAGRWFRSGRPKPESSLRSISFGTRMSGLSREGWSIAGKLLFSSSIGALSFWPIGPGLGNSGLRCSLFRH